MTQTTPLAIVDAGRANEKLTRMYAMIRDMGRVAVAYSGGVDSAFLLKVAHDLLGDDCIAVTAVSLSFSREEAEAARLLAERFGAEQVTIETHEMENAGYTANPVDRCYYCKFELFTEMEQVARDRKIPWMLYGANADDAGDWRPGGRAASEFGVRAPLQEAGLTKPEIRLLCKQLDVPVWDKPATPCLSSRIAYGVPVTPEALDRIEKAERFVRSLGFVVFRVRHHDDIARIEVPKEEFARVFANDAADRIVEELRSLGYRYVTLDLSGFRSGSMNEGIHS